MVAIDDVTFSALGLQWPFSRSLHAKAIDRLRAAGARKIVYDVQFTEPTRPSEDLAFYRAIGRTRGVVLATSEVDGRGGTNVLGGDANLGVVQTRPQATSPPTRAVSCAGLPTTSPGSKPSASRWPSRPVTTRCRDRSSIVGSLRSTIAARPATIPTVSFYGAIERNRSTPVSCAEKSSSWERPHRLFKTSHPTPTSGQASMSGPEIQANAIWIWRCTAFPCEAPRPGSTS